jgi:hypothetical protein
MKIKAAALVLQGEMQGFIGGGGGSGGSGDCGRSSSAADGAPSN